MTQRQVALVTGSGKKRVGYSVAAALAARDYALVIHYRTSAAAATETAEQLTRAHGVPALAVRADLTRERDVQALVEQVLAHYGQIDVLVNSAATWERKKLEDVTAEDVVADFQSNTLSTFLTCQLVGLHMVKQPKGGSIVNIGDWASIRPYRDYAAYFASKAAIPGLTRTFAVELGVRNPNVRVNAILPGPVMLPADLPTEEKTAAIAATLLKREGTPEHIARAVLHFIENDFITGACLPVDGGRSVYAGGS